jgi:hypothetical protein
MRSWFLATLTLAPTLALLGVVRPAALAEDQPPPVPKEVQADARGPVHEAYAEPTLTQPQAPPVMDRPPPEPINEVPPDQKPEGDDVAWIPGYWGCNGDRTDYVWVTGCWRVVPHAHKWVPGCWQQAQRGWQWVAGFWAPQEQAEVEYVPTPPESVDEGPATPAPDDTCTWVPGCWLWRQTRFVWRPGFWVAYHPNWVWLPARYVWTPAGCVFVEGYWDKPLESRGLLFAPVTIERTALVQGFTYSPQYVVQPDFLLTALFVQSATCHYYMGDYFGASYQRLGLVPWVDYQVTRGCWDANFAYYKTRFAGHAGWVENRRAVYAGRFRGDIARPPHTWSEQARLVQTLNERHIANVAVSERLHITHAQSVSALVPLSRVHNTHVTNLSVLANARAAEVRGREVEPHVMRLQPVPREQRLEHQRAAANVHVLARQRGEAEAHAVVGVGAGRAPEGPRRVRFDTSHTVQAQARVNVNAQTRNRAVAPAPPRMPPHQERPTPHHEGRPGEKPRHGDGKR